MALRDKTGKAWAPAKAPVPLPAPENVFVSKEVTKMKRLKKRLEIFLLTTFLLAASGLDGQTHGRFVIQPGSKLWMDGTSNVHDWTVEAAEMDAFVEVMLSFPASLPGSTGTIEVSRVEVFVPIAGLKSGHRIMDKKMAAALKAPHQPTIHFKLHEGGISPGIQNESGSYNLAIRGVLEIAGVANDIEMEVHVKFLSDGRLTIKGRKALKMSDFGIEPPKVLGGLFITGDDISIHFDIKMVADSGLAALFLQSWTATASH